MSHFCAILNLINSLKKFGHSSIRTCFFLFVWYLWFLFLFLVGCEGSQGDWGPSSVGHSGWWGWQRQGWGHRLGLLHGFRWIGWGLIDYSADLEDSDDNWLHDGFWGCKLRLKGRHNPAISNQTETEMISNEWRCCVHLYTLFVVLLTNKNFFPWGHHD